MNIIYSGTGPLLQHTSSKNLNEPVDNKYILYPYPSCGHFSRPISTTQPRKMLTLHNNVRALPIYRNNRYKSFCAVLLTISLISSWVITAIYVVHLFDRLHPTCVSFLQAPILVNKGYFYFCRQPLSSVCANA